MAKSNRAKTSKAVEDAVRIGERRERVLTKRRKGMTLRAIASDEGVSLGTIANDINTSLKAIADSNRMEAELLRELELERIDAMINDLNNASDSVSFNTDNISAYMAIQDRILKLVQERAKLLGLYAPAKQELSGQVALTWADFIKQAQAEADDDAPDDDFA